jgi:VanZ family protein
MGARWFWKLAAAWAAIIFVLSSIPGRSFPQSKLFGYDKVLHATVYAVLGALCFMAIRRAWALRPQWLIVAAGAMALAYGLTDEFHQLFVPGRSADLMDVLADGIGGLIGAVAGSVFPLAKPDRAS